MSTSVAKQLASRSNGVYYVAREWQGEMRIRVYTVMGQDVLGLDNLLSDEELQDLGLERKPNGVSGPNGLVIRDGNCRYRTVYAVAIAVGRSLGLLDPTDRAICL